MYFDDEVHNYSLHCDGIREVFQKCIEYTRNFFLRTFHRDFEIFYKNCIFLANLRPYIAHFLIKVVSHEIF